MGQELVQATLQNSRGCNPFSTTRDGHVALGSVKSQIGHTKATAGTAGLIKAAGIAPKGASSHCKNQRAQSQYALRRDRTILE